MSEKNILETFKKYQQEASGGEIASEHLTKTQIYNFGENMKGINEFIGAAQSLMVNLTKIKNVSEKIAWIDEAAQDSNNSAIRLERSAHVTNIKYLVANAQFMGVQLYDTNLTCAVNGRIFSTNVANPAQFLDENVDIAEYCTQKINEINALLARLNNALLSEENDSLEQEFSQSDFDERMKNFG